MRILGISAFYHDSAAAIIINGKTVAAAQEERFTRIKHDPNFPSNAIKYCLEYTGLTLTRLDAIVFYDKPLLKFERLLETYYSFAPRGLKSFLVSIPIWLDEKMFLKRLLLKNLKGIEDFDKKKVPLLFPEHHLSHAASAFYPSHFENAAILTIDGVGEWATASICHGKGSKITILKELQFPHSLGLLYSSFTYFLGFKVNSGEYKLMGLAPYGRQNSAQVSNFEKTIKNKLVEIKQDGSIWLDQEYFNYATGLKMINQKAWEKLFNIPQRFSETELLQIHCDLALAIQNVTEEIVELMALEAKRLTNADYLCLAGGVALNCVANGKLINKKIFKDIYIQPASGDAGGAPGAALAAYHIYFDQSREVDQSDSMSGAYLGPEYSNLDIEKIAKKFSAPYKKIDEWSDVYGKIAHSISEGKIIGWMQGKMEFGPRALGARSILADPRNSNTQKNLNLKIKYRESFRPFAPSVLSEDCSKYFKYEGKSPYMLNVQSVNPKLRYKLPEGYDDLTLMEKLYIERSEIPAVTHIDFSARIQTVHKETNPKFWNLISAFKTITNIGMLVNTSFNVRGEPIVCTPEDAYRCFMRTEMDYLVINNFIFKKEEQPVWTEKDDWQHEFKLD